MNTKSFWSQRRVRAAVTVSMSMLLISQLPIGSLLSTPALGQAAGSYGNNPGNDNGDFLKIQGLSNDSVVEATVVTVAAVGIYEATQGGGSAGAAAAAAAGGPGSTTATNASSQLPDPASSGDEKKSLFDVLHGDKRFSQFTGVADTNGLKDNPLSDQQNAPYTVFAPTDSAFSALPPADQQKLIGKGIADLNNATSGANCIRGTERTADGAPVTTAYGVPQGDQGTQAANRADNQKLLLKHVVLGKYSIRDLEKLDPGFPLATASGDTLTVTKNPDGTVNVDGIPVGREDIKSSNGIAHPIGTVLK